MTIANTSHEVGELVVGGDWACAHGDFSTLHFIGERLAEHAPNGLKTKLLAFAQSCLKNPDRAATEWASLRTRCFNPH